MQNTNQKAQRHEDARLLGTADRAAKVVGDDPIKPTSLVSLLRPHDDKNFMAQLTSAPACAPDLSKRSKNAD
ncbi:hypothetical protein [Methylobacterium radiotolerans]|uniref:hypothetical protein n=1 Tax=Methylobacterium radiotolerans TaxID=31998 RepID=UPI001F21DAE4|nr:hypothetical protein [Methylobacterium radiotolerans]UIY43421.1 hypothetical protein LZ599_06830 [Methylobacterium radiotolerans]